MHTQILDNIQTGVFVVDRQLKIFYWNRWLSVHTGLPQEKVANSSLENLFPGFSFELLKQKINISLKLQTNTFIIGNVSKYVLPIEQNKITKTIFRHMRQDATITPISDEQVSIVINDVSPLLEAHFTIDKQLKMLEHQAKTDFLTGCFNKNMFNKMLATEMKRSERHGHVFSLIVFDIDNFKKVNDTYGHLAGDTVLKQLASSISVSIRQSDALIRWGGEEFFILLPETLLEGGALLAEKLRQQICVQEFKVAGQLSCSFGVAQWEQGIDEDTLITQADRSLYFSKDSGRNRVSVFVNGECALRTPSSDN